MYKKISVFLLLLCICAILLLISCEPDQWVEVVLGDDHPWETASGRRFWHTVVYISESGIEQLQLSIGVRTFKILVPHASTCIIAAYPLGQGIPLGGAFHPGLDEKCVTLTFTEGPLARTLLQVAQRWPKPVSQCNFNYASQEVQYVDTNGIAIDWTKFANDLVRGTLDDDSFACAATRDVTISGLLSGLWISESPTVKSFHAYSFSDSTLEELSPGITRFMNTTHALELRLVVPDDASEQVFWHVVPLDTILRISDSDYLKLLEGSRDFT